MIVLLICYHAPNCLLGVLDLPELHHQHVVEHIKVLPHVIDSHSLAEGKLHFGELILRGLPESMKLLAYVDEALRLLVIPEFRASEEGLLLIHELMEDAFETLHFLVCLIHLARHVFLEDVRDVFQS